MMSSAFDLKSIVVNSFCFFGKNNGCIVAESFSKCLMRLNAHAASFFAKTPMEEGVDRLSMEK
jgi:hypothetical protein